MSFPFARTKRCAGRLLPPGMTVVFEDAALIVIEKPADLLSMASQSERSRTAYAFLTDYVRRGKSRSHRASVDCPPARSRNVRADGLCEVRRSKAHSADWPTVSKRYLAVVEGTPPADEGVLESHLDESGPFKVYSAPPSERTRLAVTRYRVIKRTATRTLLELTPETGRRNQLRVHLADIQCPIVGDRKYGASTNPARRLGLHASSLSFKHPLSGSPLSFQSSLPQELARLL